MIKSNKYTDEHIEKNIERYRISKSIVIETAHIKITGKSETISLCNPSERYDINDIINIIIAMFFHLSFNAKK